MKNCRLTERFLLCTNISHLTGTARVIDMPSYVRAVTGKSMRHALRTWFRDSTARFLSLTPSFRRKERKMPANFCFGLDARTRPPAIIFLPTSHCLWGPYILPPNRTCKRDSSKFAPWENFRNIIFLTRALPSELCFFCSHMTRCRRMARDFFICVWVWESPFFPFSL